MSKASFVWGIHTREFVQPKVVVSRCLGFDHCRYNGDMISSSIVEKLKNYVDFLPVCAELEIGLGVPRNPVRIVSEGGEKQRLVQPASGLDVTDKMNDFITSFFDSLDGVDGFILKTRSPSCGLKDVRVYGAMEKSRAVAKTAGFFGGAVLSKYPFLAVEDEGRLRNHRIEEHFLTKLYTLAAFRKLKNEGQMKDLVAFHTENSYLLMAYSQAELKKLGKIVANPEKKPFEELVLEYQPRLYRALSRAPRYTSKINVLMHALGHFSEELNEGEKAFFLDWVQRYRAGEVPFCPALNIIRTWIVRFGDEYLTRQTFFDPYPEGLMKVDIVDSDRREDLWK